jgi:RNA polymerase sigma-70 factor (ECF subfamily)
MTKGILVENDEDILSKLIARAKQGDPNALNSMLRHIQPRVLAHCNRLLFDPQDAEEACQDALLAVSTSIAKFEGRSSFHTWFHAITANSARATYRKLKRRASELPTSELPIVADRRTTSVIAGTRIDLLDALEQLEQDAPDLVRVLVLRELAQLEYNEIAERLKLPMGTIKTHIFRGRRRLRQILTRV